MNQNNKSLCLSRRQMLGQSACGFGALALMGMRQQDSPSEDIIRSLAARKPMFAPKAKRVIFIFMQGGSSHIDTLTTNLSLSTLMVKTSTLPEGVLEPLGRKANAS